MPEFIAQCLPVSRRKPRAYGLRAFVLAYLECAEFTFSDTIDGEDIESPPDGAVWSLDAVKRAYRDCRRFMAENEAALDIYAEQYPGSHGYSADQCAGHDFWYTRSGHGVGFWDRGTHPVFKCLSEAARAYGECFAYIGDNGRIYLA